MQNGYKKFPAVERRINYLRQELYNYDKYFRDPSNDIEVGKHAKFAIDASDHQVELSELMHLLKLAEKANRQTSFKQWQVMLVVIYSTLALIFALVAIWLSLS